MLCCETGGDRGRLVVCVLLCRMTRVRRPVIQRSEATRAALLPRLVAACCCYTAARLASPFNFQSRV